MKMRFDPSHNGKLLKQQRLWECCDISPRLSKKTMQQMRRHRKQRFSAVVNNRSERK